jgi:hypothetical protein
VQSRRTSLRGPDDVEVREWHPCILIRATDYVNNMGKGRPM